MAFRPDRRRLLVWAGLAGALPAAACGGRSRAALEAPHGYATVALVGGGEPGRRLVLTGRVLAPDGATPIPGARLDVYQTDAGGLYSRPVSTPRRARIRGSVRTDERGGYEVRTILPGPYPGQRQAAHVHAHLSAPGVPDHWIPSFLFAGDPYLSPEDVEQNRSLGLRSAIVELREDPAGTLRGHREILLDSARAERNRLVDGWYRGE